MGTGDPFDFDVLLSFAGITVTAYEIPIYPPPSLAPS